jgi:hypothetical protein
MKLHFITSLSKEYWDTVAKKCMSTWNLPGKVTVFIDQQYGDLDWISEIPYHKRLLHVPPLKTDEFTPTAKIRKFWGKACAQIVAVRNREEDERVIWLDSDIEQTGPALEQYFTDAFDAPVALMNSSDGEDCWESGLVIFNEGYGKLNQFIKNYDMAWNNEEILYGLWKPYDAQVIGYTATQKGYVNLCTAPCKNESALANTRYGTIFKHWINKENKERLRSK